MSPELSSQLRKFCRDDADFEQIQQIWKQAFLDLERSRQQAYFKIERQQALFRLISRLREPLELDAIFKSTAVEVRKLLGADRVGMFRFYPDSGWDDGEFVSEDVDPAFPSAMAKKIHDHCFGDQFANQYQAGRIQNVADIHNAGLSDCHIQVLSQFQVRANLVVPLVKGKNLWGLLCIHQCQGPRQWQAMEVEFVQQIASHLAVALQHAELVANLQLEITERQQAEAQMQALNRELEQTIIELKAVNQELEAFSYSVSHDLRAPLRSIDGFSQALIEDCLENLDDNGRDYLHRIRAATQRMGYLIDDLLTLSRVTRSEMHQEPLNLSQVAYRVIDHLQQESPDRQVRVKIQPNLHCQGDAQLLEVVFSNLLNNAWKFTAKQPQAMIEVGTTDCQDSLAYFVRDNGAGFDMSFSDKLFRPFQRLHGMREFSGNGVGLATVKRIVHRHGGEVWAEGEIGCGATFYFTLAGGKAKI